MAEGLAKGEAKGILKEKTNNIVKTLKRGKLTVEEIAEDNDVTVAFVLEIKAQFGL
jgi:predicted transposase YdaD